MSPSQSSLPMCGQQDQFKLGLLGFFWLDFSIQDTLPQLKVVVLKKLSELRWVRLFKWALSPGPILHPHNHKAQDRVCPLGITPITKVMQTTHGPSPTGPRTCRLQLYVSKRLTGPLGVATCMVCTATAVTQWCVPNVLGTHLGQDTLDKASTSMLVFPAL